MRKNWYRSVGQRKNEKGSSGVTALVVMTLVLILVMMVMSLALVNFRLKSVNFTAQENFYSAETALEEIRLGLSEAMSGAMAEAYTDTVQKYSILEAEEREANFREVFLQRLKTEIGYQTVNGTEGIYSPEYLEGLLKETAYWDDFGLGAKVTSAAGGNRVNITEEGLILKNVVVTHQNSQDYVTKIRTDIVLAYPKIDFFQNSAMPELTSYALVAGTNLDIEPGCTCEIAGNAYLGEAATTVEQAVLKIKAGADMTDRGLVISADMIKGSSNAQIEFSGIELWAEDLVVDSSVLDAEDTAVYLRNDLVLANSLLTSTKAKISGEFYGYGSIDTAGEALSASADEAERIAQNPADYSSSIIINGIRSSLDLSGLDAMKISGTSYINGAEHREEYQSGGNRNGEDIRMGESLSVRPDQVAYLVPSECIAPELKNGGTNPMPVSQYSALLRELEQVYGADGGARLVDSNVRIEKYGASLAELGANGWQTAAQQVNGIGSMVYVFLKFDSVESANAFFRKYYDNTDAAKLGEILDLYADQGIRLPQAVLAQTADDRFYFNGNVLASDSASLYVPDRLSTVSGDAEKLAALQAEEIGYQDNFAALNRKLTKDYAALTDREKRRRVFDNLVKDLVSDQNAAYTIGTGTTRIFVKATGEAAVVTNGDYIINAANRELIRQTADMEGNRHEEAVLSVVIATGDITVTEDFSGLLLAGGSIHIKEDLGRKIRLTADREAASQALMAGNAEGVHVYDYLVNGESYLIPGNAEGTEESYSSRSLDMLDYITYENWSRQ